MEIEQQIKERVKCCSCGGSLEESEHINIVTTNKVATWKYPVAGNVFIHDAPKEATAIVCDNCIKSKSKIINAIEILPGVDGFENVIYHKLEDLEDEPDWVRRAKENLSRPNPIFN